MLVKHLIAPDMEGMLSNYCYCCSVIAILWWPEESPVGMGDGVPRGMGVEQGLCAQLQRVLSALRGAVMAHFLREGTEAPREGEGHRPGGLWVVGRGMGGLGEGLASPLPPPRA